MRKTARTNLLIAWEFVKERWSSYVFAVGSTGYGLILYLYPQLLTRTEAYQFLNRAFDFLGSEGLGVLFFTFGLLKLLATTFNWRRTRLTTLLFLEFLWISLSFSLGIQAINGSMNAGWFLTLLIAINGLNVVIAGRVKM